MIIFFKTVEKALHNAEKNIEIHQETAENEHFEILANQFQKVIPDFEPKIGAKSQIFEFL